MTIFRGYNLHEAFENPVQSVQSKPIRLQIDDEYARTMIERTDAQSNITYGIGHTPGAHMKVYNASRNTADSSIALSFSPSKDNFEDIFKIVKKPNGGYELHLQKIQTIVIDGKRVDVSSLSSFI